MENKSNIESKINEVLETARKVQQVETPAFFTDKTLQRLRIAKKEEKNFSKMSLLRVAAVIVLLVINVYTIQYILSSKQQNLASTNTTTVQDLVNDYQPNDRTELTFENKYIQ